MTPKRHNQSTRHKYVPNFINESLIVFAQWSGKIKITFNAVQYRLAIRNDEILEVHFIKYEKGAEKLVYYFCIIPVTTPAWRLTEALENCRLFLYHTHYYPCQEDL